MVLNFRRSLWEQYLLHLVFLQIRSYYVTSLTLFVVRHRLFLILR